MRFLPHIGVFNATSGARTLASGLYYNTQPTQVPLGSLAVEDGKVYEFRRLSGATWTAGSLAYNTGTAGNNYVCLSGTGTSRPVGVNLVTTTGSGVWTWLLKYGKGNVQCTNTFGIAASLTQAMYSIGGSGAYNLSGAMSAALIGSGGTLGIPVLIGYALSDCVAATAGTAFIQLL